MAYLGIDLGTSGLRALLTDADGTPLGSAEAQYSARSPQAGWAEQDPQDWLDALDLALAQLRDACPQMKQLRAIAVAGHMHGVVTLDSAGAVLRPCILWNDTRSHAEAAQLDALPEMRALSGNIVFPGFTAPKLEWMRHNEPDLYARIDKVLLPAAFLNLYLTGEAVGDISDASGTCWLDVGARRWSPVLLQRTNMQASQMPRLVEGSAAAGTLRPELRRRWGLEHDVVVAGGSADNAAAACGMGVLRAGQGFVSLGTSGVVLAAKDGYHPDPQSAVHSFCHAVPDTWYQMGVMLAATDSLNWLARMLGKGPEALTAELGPQLRPPCDVLFLPYLSGERTPHNSAHLRGGFLGLSTATTRADMTHAVLQGVCCALRDCLDAVCNTGGETPTSLYVIGGGSASDYWVKMLATVLNLPLMRPQGGEFGAALGAARLAQAASLDACPGNLMPPPARVQTFDPEPELIARYAKELERFRTALTAATPSA